MLIFLIDDDTDDQEIFSMIIGDNQDYEQDCRRNGGRSHKPPAHEKFVELAFRDNGIGFEPEYQDQIFKLFQRLHAKTKYNGTGVGLSIVARIVERHHGYIKATSESNKGTTFTTWLPIET